ncbi:MAG: TIR domain-containing protein [Saprospiraceae bacterium]
MSKPLKIFISYARKDADYKDELLVHLKPLKRNGIIEAWHDSDVEAGDEWEPEILRQLETADVLLFLVSPNFMASDYIYNKEIVEAKKRHDRKETVIVPIWIKPVSVPDDFLNKFQSLPKDRKPVSQWADHDEAWVDVVQRLKKLFDKLQNKTAETPQQSLSDSNNDAITHASSGTFSKAYIRELIGKSRTKDALTLLLDHTADTDAEAHNTLTLLASRFNETERNRRLGIVSHADLQLEHNRINMALLSLLDEIE